ncbi:hypothetical protein C7B69_15600 [filamentous cyanobacterium Phorm 46]|nr:hypothetical protein C7B69_15600 [filamentous cyanobacterium Phorm 46]PSB47995.1 hypothetical protein C7B67_18520 [filamentous cyanobacterium Phorm 6]
MEAKPLDGGVLDALPSKKPGFYLICGRLRSLFAKKPVSVSPSVPDDLKHEKNRFFGAAASQSPIPQVAQKNKEAGRLLAMPTRFRPC